MTANRRTIFLCLVIIATAVLWSGVSGVKLNADDYQYLPSLAPIQSFADIFRPFITRDFNPSFFRPLANMTMSLDFLLFHWSGKGFHLTNLLFHLIATALTFYFARDNFKLSEKVSLWTALVFGIAASHEYNLVVDTARADSLVAIFALLTLLFQKKALGRNSQLFSVLAWIFFALTLLSKESGILILPVVAVIFWKGSWHQWRQNIPNLAVHFAPYCLIAVGFYFYHQHFTWPITETQPLTAEGAHSIIALIKNGIYSIGYFFVPVDLSVGTLLITRYKTIAFLFGLIVAIVAIILVWKYRSSEIIRQLTFPLAFSVLSGLVLFFTFERWRVYLPSVGLAAIVPVLMDRSKSKISKSVGIVLLIPLLSFHLFRALEAERDWSASTELLDRLKADLTQILSTVPKRPVTIGFLDVPAKLGSATVLQLGRTAFLQCADVAADSSFHRTGEVKEANTFSWSAVDVYSLDTKKKYSELSMERISPNVYSIVVPSSSEMFLFPSTIGSNQIARRDRAFHVGDTIEMPEFIDIIRSASDGLAKSIEVHVKDTNSIVLHYSDSGFVPVSGRF